MFVAKGYKGIDYLFFINKATGKRAKITAYKAEDILTNYLTIKPATQAASILLSQLQTEVLNYTSKSFSKATALIYSHVLNRLVTILGNKPIHLITGRVIEDYKLTRLKSIGKVSCNIEIRTIKAIFNLAVKWGMLAISPAAAVKQYAVPQNTRVAFSEDEMKLILETITDIKIKNIILFALFTGCRLNEILNIQYKDISLEQGIIVINNKADFTTKSGKTRAFPIAEPLKELLELIMFPPGKVINLYDPDTYLFNYRGFKMGRSYISHKFKKYIRLLNLNEKYCFHCLRHTWATKLVKAGVNLRYIKQLAGHADVRTTENYIHVNMDELRKVVSMIK